MMNYSQKYGCRHGLFMFVSCLGPSIAESKHLVICHSQTISPCEEEVQRSGRICITVTKVTINVCIPGDL